MAGIKLAGESDGPTTLGSWGHRALLVEGEPPRREIFSHSPTHPHKHKWDEQVGLPPPAPESRTSIADPLPAGKMKNETQQLNNPFSAVISSVLLSPSPLMALMERGIKGEKVPSSPSPSTKLERGTCARAQVPLSVYSSPSPLMALRERGIKGVRVPSHFLKQSNPCLKSQNNQNPRGVPGHRANASF